MTAGHDPPLNGSTHFFYYCQFFGHASKPSQKKLILPWLYSSFTHTNQFPISSELYI